MLYSILKDIFKKEYDRFVSFCRKRKIFVITFFIFLFLVVVDFRFGQPPVTPFLLGSFIDCLKQIPQWLTTLVFGVWLIFITFLIFSSKRWGLTFKGDFFDDFKRGLRSSEWEWYGNWRIEEEENKNVLSVTNSPDGGFTRVGAYWTNYNFTFDTKILNKFSSWLLRVKDKHNYLMFQCWRDRIVPHIRINSYWEVCEPIFLDNHLTIKINMWYKVKIIVRGDIIEIEINGNNIRYTIPPTTTPNLPKLYENNRRATFDTGSLRMSGRVGFRNDGNEKALFRKVKMTTIH